MSNMAEVAQFGVRIWLDSNTGKFYYKDQNGVIQEFLGGSGGGGTVIDPDTTVVDGGAAATIFDNSVTYNGGGA